MFFSKKFCKYKNLKHCFFSRKNGFSDGYYKSLNCGSGSKDKRKNIIKNLKYVSKKIGCKKNFLVTLNQTHSNNVVYFKNSKSIKDKMNGDAIVTQVKNVAIGILTADCAPILFYDPVQKIIACVHSGWKGALNGVIKNTLKKFKKLKSNNKDLIVVVGPCIKKENYKVRSDFYKKFILKNKIYKKFFNKITNNQYLFDLRKFINYQIADHNIQNIDNINMDTFSNEKNFYSYRRSRLNKEKDYGRCISVILMT